MEVILEVGADEYLVTSFTRALAIKHVADSFPHMYGPPCPIHDETMLTPDLTRCSVQFYDGSPRVLQCFRLPSLQRVQEPNRRRRLSVPVCI